MKCFFRTYHEYRFSLSLAFFVGLINGLVDASILDFSIKAFVWSSILVIVSMIISYEFIIMDTPEKPRIQAILFVIVFISGLLSIHHFTWLITWILLYGSIDKRIWLAPNIYIDLFLYNLIMLTLMFIYIIYIIYTNLCSLD